MISLAMSDEIISVDENKVKNNYISYNSYNNPPVSIIVPVYNVEQYLMECIKSILQQTYSNFELILIDDGSTDKSGSICDNLQSKDNRIRVIHKSNGGLSSARNVGIEVAYGNYYVFIDSDDYIDKKFIECLYKEAVEKNADICECSYAYLKNGKIINERLFEYSILDNETAVRKLFSPPYQSFVIVCNKLYRKELFENIRFPEGKLHEDEFTTYKLIYESNKIAYVNKNLYIYRIRDNSITTSEFSSKRAEVLDSIEEKKAYFRNININLDEELKFNEFVVKINVLNMMVDFDSYDNVLWNKISREIKIKRKELFQCPFLKNGHKMYIIMLLIGKWSYVMFRNCVKFIYRERRKV